MVRMKITTCASIYGTWDHLKPSREHAEEEAVIEADDPVSAMEVAIEASKEKPPMDGAMEVGEEEAVMVDGVEEEAVEEDPAELKGLAAELSGMEDAELKEAVAV